MLNQIRSKHIIILPPGEISFSVAMDNWISSRVGAFNLVQFYIDALHGRSLRQQKIKHPTAFSVLTQKNVIDAAHIEHVLIGNEGCYRRF